MLSLPEEEKKHPLYTDSPEDSLAIVLCDNVQ